MPKRKFRPVTPKVTATNPPLPQAPPKPSNEVPPTVRADTPWPGAGKMSGKATCLMIDNGFSQKVI